MIKIERHILDNGLTVIAHVDRSTPLAALNVLYKVGARNEDPQRTGFAHLFEHLMFGGSKNIPSYDSPLQMVGGDNNAFTSNDITNYYLTLPANNIETGFWLESDRMMELAFSPEILEVQRKVVIEEFKQRYLNQPYGDIPLLARPLAYKVHPYQWPTIGKDLLHIEQATLDDVKDFFYSHYAPNNAIVTVTGNIDPQEIFKMAEKWFGPIPKRQLKNAVVPREPEQTELRELHVTRPVPADYIQVMFHMPGRVEPGYQVVDLLSDLLANGQSSRLVQSLMKENQLFSDINAYISGDNDPGLFTVTGNMLPGISLETGYQAIWDELNKLKDELVSEYELQKVKNRVESVVVFSEISFLNKAMNLAHYEMIGKAEDINLEVEQYRCITREDLQSQACRLFRPENCSVLYYHAKEKENQ
ncbi:MAG: M16 family metallopeptidase [Breznakibacter sp.]